MTKNEEGPRPSVSYPGTYAEGNIPPSEHLERPQFRTSAFVLHFLYHLFAPLSLPFLLLIEGKNLALNEFFLLRMGSKSERKREKGQPNEAVWGPVAFVYNHLLNICVFAIVFMTFFYSSSRAEGGSQIYAFEVIAVVILHMTRLLLVAVKYGFLLGDPYWRRRICGGVVDFETMSSQLLSLWLKPPRQVIRRELNVAAERLGQPLKSRHFLYSLDSEHVMCPLAQQSYRGFSKLEARGRDGGEAGDRGDGGGWRDLDDRRDRDSASDDDAEVSTGFGQQRTQSIALEVVPPPEHSAAAAAAEAEAAGDGTCPSRADRFRGRARRSTVASAGTAGDDPNVVACEMPDFVGPSPVLRSEATAYDFCFTTVNKAVQLPRRSLVILGRVLASTFALVPTAFRLSEGHYVLETGDMVVAITVMVLIYMLFGTVLDFLAAAIADGRRRVMSLIALEIAISDNLRNHRAIELHGTESLSEEELFVRSLSLPQCDSTVPENIATWALCNRVFMIFGWEYRLRLEFFAAISAGGVLCVLAILVGQLLFNRSAVDPFSIVFSLTFALSFAIYLALLFSTGVKLNGQYAVNEQTLIMTKLRILGSSRFDLLPRLARVVPMLDTAIELVRHNARANPIRVCGVIATPGSLRAILGILASMIAWLIPYLTSDSQL